MIINPNEIFNDRFNKLNEAKKSDKKYYVVYELAGLKPKTYDYVYEGTKEECESYMKKKYKDTPPSAIFITSKGNLRTEEDTD